MSAVTIDFSDEMIETLAERVSERLVVRKPLHTTESLAEALNMSVRAIRGLRAQGMPARKPGRRCVYDLDECLAWIRSHPHVPVGRV